MITFIINPVSGGGKAIKLFPKIEQMMIERGMAYKVHHTALPICREQFKDIPCEKEDIVVVAGGDGTMIDILNNLPTLDMTLMYLPCGTGNDFIKTLGLPKDPIKAFEKQLDGKERRIDLCSVNDRLFINVCGIGFDSEVVAKIDELRRELTGIRAYLAGVARSLKEYKPFECRIVIDGKDMGKGSYALMSIGNGRFIGGGMKALPTALPDDGLFDAAFVGPIRKWQASYLLPLFIFGKHVKLGCVKTLRCKTVEITSDNMMKGQVDGEIFTAAQVKLKIMPGALRLKC